MIIPLARLLAVLDAEIKPSIQTDIPRSTYYAARGGRALTPEIATAFLAKARSVFGPQVMGIEAAGQTHFAPEIAGALTALVAENVARRLEEILRFTLNAEVTPLTMRVLEAQARQAALEDERVANATSTATYANKTLSLSVRLLLIEGETFNFVLSVDQVTTELLFG